MYAGGCSVALVHCSVVAIGYLSLASKVHLAGLAYLGILRTGCSRILFS